MEGRYSKISDLSFSLLAPELEQQCLRRHPHKDPWNAFGLLYRCEKDPRESEISLPSSALLQHRPRQPSEKPACLVNLPGELIGIILENTYLTEYDTLAFGLCCKTLWLHTIERVRQTFRRGQWANTPIICAGENASYIPPAIQVLYPQLKAQVDQWRSRRLSLRTSVSPVRLWIREAGKTYSPVNILDREAIWLDAFIVAGKKSSLDRQTLDVLVKDLRAIIKTAYPNWDATWYLRDLDTREFVRLDHSRRATDGEIIFNVKGEPHLVLDMAVAMRIAYGLIKRSPGARPSSHAVEGVWAGHRLDVIAPVANVPGLKGWTDVTDQVIQEWNEWEEMRF